MLKDIAVHKNTAEHYNFHWHTSA